MEKNPNVLLKGDRVRYYTLHESSMSVERSYHRHRYSDKESKCYLKEWHEFIFGVSSLSSKNKDLPGNKVEIFVLDLKKGQKTTMDPDSSQRRENQSTWSSDLHGLLVEDKKERKREEDTENRKPVSKSSENERVKAIGEVNMEASITEDDVIRAGGLGARDDISSFLPIASDSTDFEATIRDAREYEELQCEVCKPGLGWREAPDAK